VARGRGPAGGYIGVLLKGGRGAGRGRGRWLALIRRKSCTFQSWWGRGLIPPT